MRCIPAFSGIQPPTSAYATSRKASVMFGSEDTPATPHEAPQTAVAKPARRAFGQVIKDGFREGKRFACMPFEMLKDMWSRGLGWKAIAALCVLTTTWMEVPIYAAFGFIKGCVKNPHPAQKPAEAPPQFA